MAGVPFYRRLGAPKRRPRLRQDTIRRWHLSTLLGRGGVRGPKCAVRRLSTVGLWAMFAMQPVRAGVSRAVRAPRVRQLGRDVDLQLDDAQGLSFAAESFETVIVTPTVCAVPDHPHAIHEVARVVRSDGCLVWLRARSQPGPI
jgi:hypothetical protein